MINIALVVLSIIVGIVVVAIVNYLTSSSKSQHKKEKEHHKKEEVKSKPHKEHHAAPVHAPAPAPVAAPPVEEVAAAPKKKKARSNKSKASKSKENPNKNKFESLAVSDAAEDDADNDTDSVASDAIIPSKAAQALLKKSKEMAKLAAALEKEKAKAAEKEAATPPAPEKKEEEKPKAAPAKKVEEKKKASKKGKKDNKSAEPAAEAPVEHVAVPEEKEEKPAEVADEWAVVKERKSNKPKAEEEAAEVVESKHAVVPVVPEEEDEDDKPHVPAVEVVTADVIVDAQKLGLLIGPKGNTKIAIQQATGTIIQMPKAGKDVSGDVTIVVSRPQEGVNTAVFALNELSTKGYASLLVPEGFQESYVAVHQKYLPDIIGKSGAVIRALNTHTGVKITVPSTTKQPAADGKIPKVKIGLAGPKDKVSECRALIKELTKNYVTSVTHPDQTFAEMEIPKNYYNYIIGSKGSEIKHIQNSYKVSVHIPDENSVNPNVVIVGEEGNVSNAQKHIQKIIDRVNGTDRVEGAEGAEGELAARPPREPRERRERGEGGSGKHHRERKEKPANGAAEGENVAPTDGNADAKAVAPPAPGLTAGKSWGKPAANAAAGPASGQPHHPPTGDEPDEAWTRDFLPPVHGMDLGAMLPAHGKFHANPNANAAQQPIGHHKNAADKNPTPSGHPAPIEPKVPAGTTAWNMNAVNASQW